MQFKMYKKAVFGIQGRLCCSRIVGIILALTTIGLSTAYAQFEGTFKVNQYIYTANGRSQKVSTARIYMTPNRIRINGLNGSKMPAQLGGMNANSILIRLDMQDFVIFGQNSQAVQIKKSEIVNMVNMIDNLEKKFGDSDGDNDTIKDKVKVEHAKGSRIIDGYKCHKIVVIDKDNNDIHKTVVWLTKQLPVNWGMLTQSWGDNSNEMAQLLTPAWLQNGNLPVYAIMYENGIKKSALRVADIKKQKVPHSLMIIPQNVQLLSFRQLLLHNMFGR